MVAVLKSNVPQRRKPQGSGWRMVDINENWTAWKKGGVYALSSVIEVEDEHQPLHWEWMISFSYMGQRVLTNKELKKPIKDFCAEGFEEDNHEKGIVRKFFMAVEPKYRVPCPCKDEIIITEGEYSYSAKK